MAGLGTYTPAAGPTSRIAAGALSWSLGVAGEATLIRAGDYFVAPTGSDAYPGTYEQPFKTIQKGADEAGSSDIVVVLAGDYNESVNPTNDGVYFLGSGKPKIHYTASHVFWSTSGVANITLDGFELEGSDTVRQNYCGILAWNCEGWTIKNNDIHHMDRYGAQLRGTYHSFTDNQVHHLLGHDEAMGIQLNKAVSAEVLRNQVYLVRKNPGRDIRSESSVWRHNIFYLAWSGFALNDSSSDLLFENNYIHHCSRGATLKHANFVLGKGWNVVQYNDFYMNQWADVVIGQNRSAVDYLRVQRNYFHQAGDSMIQADSAFMLSNIDIDENAYHQEGGRPAHYFVSDHPDTTIDTLADLVADTPYADNGVDYTAQTGYGASGLSQTTPGWLNMSMSAIDQTSGDANDALGWEYQEYWQGGDNFDEELVFDLGTTARYNWFWISQYGVHNSDIRTFEVQTSDDDVTYTAMHVGTADMDTPPWYNALDAECTARYVKLLVTDNYGNTSVTRCREFMVGLLE
jgi:hypothetical protein